MCSSSVFFLFCCCSIKKNPWYQKPIPSRNSLTCLLTLVPSFRHTFWHKQYNNFCQISWHSSAKTSGHNIEIRVTLLGWFTQIFHLPGHPYTVFYFSSISAMNCCSSVFYQACHSIFHSEAFVNISNLLYWVPNSIKHRQQFHSSCVSSVVLHGLKYEKAIW